ncbi:translocation/assembly module TamB domain-containing protein [Tunicatimonas pelagia]|uniref:translocation/assembly module TamB domain-containing protein n=1 Tax=Tunicatimonas pelagia TaxID=931531 RepID=UPI0026650DD7|nr:translocation/assembly module TamB domain-containing protein [Tunicatimonas pelagia]WKN44344.1 translocation/assembly module TamB domain-containing protein [Tunicatimonas pelagia]
MAILILLFIAVVGAVQIPQVQTQLVQYLAKSITERTGFSTSIEGVHIKWFDTGVLDSVTIMDDENRPMIIANHLTVDFDIRTIVDDGNIFIDEAQVKGGVLNLRKDAADATLNITRFIDTVKSIIRKPRNPKVRSTPPLFTISEVSLEEVTFQYHDAGANLLPDRFDYNHFTVYDIYADASNLQIVADTLQVDIHHMRGYEPDYDLTIDDFSGFYRFTNHSMLFQDFELHAGNSVLRDSLVFNYRTKASLGYFNDSVTLVANIKDSELHAEDLARFAPTLLGYDDAYRVSGYFNGQVSDFTLSDMTFSFGNTSQLVGKVSFDGLPETKEAFTDLQLKNSRVSAADLRQYVNNEKAYRTIEKFGTVDFNAEFLGFPDDFVANGQFTTRLGGIESDINLKLEDTPIYSGSLSLQDFDLGTLTDEPELLQRTSFQGYIEGEGITVEAARFNLAAEFDYLGLNQYTYQNITTDARLARSFFEGKLTIDDPNLRFTADGTLDFREGEERIKLAAKLDTAFFHELNLSDKYLFLSTQIDADTRGLKVDDLSGRAAFDDLYIAYDDRQLFIDSLRFQSDFDSLSRQVKVQTERVKAELVGNFKFTTLVSDIQKLAKEYQLIFRNDREELNKYYATRQVDSIQHYQDQSYEISYRVELKNANPLLQMFVPEVVLSQNFEANGRLTGGYTNIFSVHSTFDTLQFRDHYFYDNSIEFTTSKIVDSTSVLAMLYMESAQQNIATSNLQAPMEDLSIEAIWSGDHIDFQQYIRRQGTDNYANLLGEVEFLNDSTLIRFQPSNLQVLDQRWEFSPQNQILISNQEIIFDQFKVFSGTDDVQQEISAIGTLSTDPNKQLTVNINRFQIANLSPILEEEYEGEINGFVDLRGMLTNPADTLQSLILDSEIAVNDFTINAFEVGNIIGLAKWNNQRQNLNLNVMVNRDGQRIISINGEYDPKQEEDQLDLKANLRGASITIAEPYVDDFFTELEGNVNGTIDITGRLNYPILRGNGTLADGHIRINYLNTRYNFDGGVFFDANTIGVEDLVLQDERKQTATFNGGIFHDGFRDFVLDLNGSLSNVAVLNTTLQDNDMFYGRGYATGTVSLLGAIDNLDITARAKTEKGTKIYIPVGGIEGVEQSDFIKFVKTDSLLAAESKIDKVSLTGLNLDLDIEVTPDAYGEIIFDVKTGDIIRGRGQGQMQMLISSQGDFTMFGDLRFVEGGYNFTLYNIINKEFNIEPGSSIAWLGDPYGGVLDIQATYAQVASLAPLVVDPNQRDNDEVRRKYPTEVALELTGDLMSPDIDFDINILNYPQNNLWLRTAVETLNNTVAYDQEELNRQVFSLIVLRQFSEQGSFDVGGSVGSSVSELLSNQFSYWLSQVDENLEIDVDLGSFDNDRFNTFQLRLSYSFLEGRLRVTRDGGFTDLNNNANAATVIGDVSVEYLLTDDGRYRVKMYNRNNFNSLTNPLNQDFNTTQGISLMYIQSFDKVRDLLTSTRNRVIQERKDDSQVDKGDAPKPLSQSTEKATEPELRKTLPK